MLGVVGQQCYVCLHRAQHISQFDYLFISFYYCNFSADVDPVQVTVRNLTLAKFVFSPENETFDLHITWQRPSFNYSKISEYSFTCQVNGRAKITGRTVRDLFP